MLHQVLITHPGSVHSNNTCSRACRASSSSDSLPSVSHRFGSLFNNDKNSWASTVQVIASDRSAVVPARQLSAQPAVKHLNLPCSSAGWHFRHCLPADSLPAAGLAQQLPAAGAESWEGMGCHAALSPGPVNQKDIDFHSGENALKNYAACSESYAGPVTARLSNQKGLFG